MSPDSKMLPPAPVRPSGYFRRQQHSSSPSSFAAASITLLLALALFLTTFSKAAHPDPTLAYPSMSPVFELAYLYGRYAALGLMICAIVVAKLAYEQLNWALAGSLYGFLILNAYLLAKTALYGNVEVFVLGVPALVLQIIALTFVISTVSARNGNLPFTAEVIFLYAVLLVSVNLYVAYRFPESTWVWHGRFFGITSNSQHLGMAVALSAPALVYHIQKGSFRRFVSIALLAGCMLISYFTGSRAASAAILLAIAIPLIFGIKSARRRFSSLCLLSCAVIAILTIEVTTGLLHARFIDDRQDTRSVEWGAAFEEFVSNPLFGVDITHESGRFMFTMNTWLAAANSGGLLAIVCSFFIISSILVAAIGLIVRDKQLYVSYTPELYISAAAMIIWLSLFEALFLGIFSAHTMLLVVWLGGLHNMAQDIRQSHQKPVFDATFRRKGALYGTGRESATSDES